MARKLVCCVAIRLMVDTHRKTDYQAILSKLNSGVYDPLAEFE